MFSLCIAPHAKGSDIHEGHLRIASIARAHGCQLLKIETQNNNVAACRLYESCGFQLGGFDRYLYQATMPGTGEIALYWYLLFEND